MEAKLAEFRLNSYAFTKAHLDLSEEQMQLDLSFEPSGVFYTTEKYYELNLVFRAVDCKTKKTIVETECKAQYEFRNEIAFEQIPDFFYANSIAIIFPYIRAFISTLTLQANFVPIVLPTLNLTPLSQQLKSNTSVK